MTRSCATWRGKPRWTAASMSASMTRKTYVGPVPETAVAIATNFSSSTSSSAPSAPSRARRLGALLGGRLGRRVPDGHPLAEPGRGVGHAPDDLVVAEEAGQRRRRGARRGRSGPAGRGSRCGPISRPTRPSIWGLIAEQDDVGALDRLDVARRRSGCRSRARGPRAARRAGGWRRPGPGATSWPRSRPAIIASAMTPEPTVAIVRCCEG